MAIIKIDIAEVCSEEQKQALIAAVTSATAEAISVTPERVRVVLRDLNTEPASFTEYEDRLRRSA